MSEETQTHGRITGFNSFDRTIKDLCDHDARIVSTDLATLVAEFHVPGEIVHFIEAHIIDLVLDNARLASFCENSDRHLKMSLPDMSYELDKIIRK